jgi:hypothetical protein
MRAALLVVAFLSLGLGLAACSKSESASKQLDPTLIEVVDNARLRTDTVGLSHHIDYSSRVDPKVIEDRRFASESTFVLVDAKNPTPDGAYVTLAGELLGDGGTKIGALKAQSLWIPAGETRTFALIDSERVPRPATTSAKIVVTGALVTRDPPRVRITDTHSFVDKYTEADKPVSRIVVQANVVNDTKRIGKAIVIASFHGADGRPITRPFQTIQLAGNQTMPIQFVGPVGSTTGTIFVGDVIY